MTEGNTLRSFLEDKEDIKAVSPDERDSNSAGSKSSSKEELRASPLALSNSDKSKDNLKDEYRAESPASY